MDVGYLALAIVLLLLFYFLIRYKHIKDRLNMLETAANVYASTLKECERLSKALSDLKCSYNIAIKDKESLNHELATLKNNTSCKNNEVRIKELSSLINRYQVHFDSLTKQRETLQKRIRELEKSEQNADICKINELQARIQLLDNKCAHHHNNYIELENKYKKLKQEYELLLTQSHLDSETLAFLLSSFPALQSFLDTYKIAKENTYPSVSSTSTYLEEEEYEALSKSELLQLALDRYISSHKKTDWQIGRDYELSVGHEYMRAGYRVDFTGTSEKFHDLGRDLIAYKGRETYIIQCKFWGKGKSIQEKHISQLYGTTTYYRFQHPDENVHAVFITNVHFSPTAKKFASFLGVELQESHQFTEFPRIKCNIRYDAETGTSMIYHLPMDPQYDRVKIQEIGECYAYTVEEAESYGFRHAEKN